MRKSSVIKKVLIILVITIIILVIILNLPFVTLNHRESKNDYSNWMSETLTNDMLAVDIKMPGAHDAFSSGINIFSKLDPYNTDSIMKRIPGVLLKGFIVRQAVTQISIPKTLLEKGVRYFDIRLTYDDEKWITKHNYLSSDFPEAAAQITEFLKENPGEFLILDFQHIDGLNYEIDNDYDIFYSMLQSTGLAQYSYDRNIKELSTITYGDLTDEGTRSRVIIIDKFQKSNKKTFLYSTSIRSSWANSDDFDKVISFLEEEKSIIDNNSDIKGFRVMQAVATMQMNFGGIINAIKTWSLIERAEDFNIYLFEYDGFKELSEIMPIIMIDYSDSYQFVDYIMNFIKTENN